MYEVFEDDDGKVFETGNIIFADLKLSGKIILYIILIKKEVKDTMMRMVRVLKKH